MRVLRFLHGREVLSEIARRRLTSGRFSVAVAYIGREPRLRLDLRPGDRVICDLDAAAKGSLDPRAVRELIACDVSVRKAPGLHAKVYLAENWAVVGSANPSKNAEKALEEAAVLSEGPAFVRSISRWFEDQWERARVVPPGELEELIRAYDIARRALRKLDARVGVRRKVHRAPSHRSYGVITERRFWYVNTNSDSTERQMLKHREARAYGVRQSRLSGIEKGDVVFLWRSDWGLSPPELPTENVGSGICRTVTITSAMSQFV